MAALARGKPDVSAPFGFNRIITLENFTSKLQQLLNVKYILSTTDLDESYLKLVYKAGETKVYEDTRALPRAYLVERFTRSGDKEDTINKLYNVSDLRLEAVVEGEPDVGNIPFQFGEIANIVLYESSRIEVDVAVDVPRLLIIANAYDSGWKATVDGLRARTYRANYAYLGIVVPKGNHRVVLSYSSLY